MMRTTGRWIGYCGPDFREKLVKTVLTLDPHATLTISSSAIGLRDDVLRTPGTHVVIGTTEEGVSEVNLAAAIVADGAALDVTLVVNQASGSLKSRAATAGVSDVIDLSQFNLAARPAYGRPVTVTSPGYPAGEGFARRSRGAEPLAAREGRGTEAARSDELTSVLGAGTSDEVTSVLGVAPKAAQPALASGCRDLPDRWKDDSSAALFAQASSPRMDSGVADGRGEVVPGQGEAGSFEQAEVPDLERGNAPILVFVSGRGGVGKTVMSATAACIAASWGLKVGLCDLDFSCGNLYAAFGLPRAADLTPLAGEGQVDLERVERLGVACGEDIRLWGGCSRPEMAEALWPHAGEIVCAASQLSDLVLVDTSSTFTDAVAQSAQLCDRLLITIDGRPGSTVAQSRLGALAVRLGVARTRIARVANRCDPKGRDETLINRADVGLETARSHRVMEGGEIVSEFLAAGQIAALAEEPSPFVESLATCLAQLLSEMGRLPNCDAAKSALEPKRTRRKRLFGRRREAV